jgi:hypothetical protein
MVDVTVGIQQNINIAGPACIVIPACPAVDHDTHIVIDEHGVGPAESLVCKVYGYLIVDSCIIRCSALT